MSLLHAALLHVALAFYAPPTLKADLPGHTDKVTGVQLSADESTLVSASADHTVRLWDLAAKKELRTITTKAPLFNLVLQQGPGGKAFTSGGAWKGGDDYEIFSIDASKDSTRTKPDDRFDEHTGSVLSLAMSGDDKLVASGSRDGTVRIWNASDGKQVDSLNLGSPIGAVAFDRGGMLLFAPSDRTVRVWDIAKKKEIDQIPFEKNVLALATSHGDRYLIAAASANGEVRVFEVGTGLLATFKGEAAPIALAFNDAEDTLFSVTQSGEVLQLSLDLEIATTLLSGVKARSVHASKGGHLLAVGTSDGKTLVYGLQQARPELVLDPQAHTAQVMDLAFTPDGRSLVSVSKDKTLRVWDVVSGENVKTLRGFSGPGPDGELFRLAVSPDGKDVVMGGFLGPNRGKTVGYLRVMSLETGKVRQLIHRGSNTVTGLTWKSRVVSSSTDAMVRTWNLDNWSKAIAGEKANTNAFKGAGPILFTTISPSGQYIVSNEFGSTAPTILDVSEVSAEGKARSERQLSGKHQSEVVAAAYTPDGKTLITVDQNEAFLWSANGDFQGGFPGKFRVAADCKPTFSADGKMIALADQVLEFPSGKELSKLNASMTVRTAIFRGNDLIASSGPQSMDSGQSDGTIVLWDPLTGKEVRRLAPKAHQYNGLAFLDGGLGIALTDESGATPATFTTAQLKTGFDFTRLHLAHPSSPSTRLSNRLVVEARGIKLEREGTIDKVVDGRMVSSENLGRLKFGKLTIEHKDQGGGVNTFTLLPDGSVLIGGSQTMRSYDSAGAETKHFAGHAGGLKALALSSDGKLLASLGEDLTVRLWKLDDPGEQEAGHHVVRPLVSLFLAGDGEWIAWTEDSAYASSRHGGRYLGFQVNQGREKEAKFYPFEQYDLRFNRPDLLLARLGVGEPALREALAHAWKKRVVRMGFTEAAVNREGIALPQLTLRTPSQSTAQRTLELDVAASSEAVGLDRLQLYVNDVPVLGRAGLPLNGVKSMEKKVPVKLTPGRNKVQVSVLDASGVESPRETIVVRCEAPAVKPTLLVVAVGVSHYKDSQYDLTYAAKDARDLTALLGAKSAGYQETKVLLLDDAKATREGILQAKQFLSQGTVDDEAVVFFAGHGLLDEKFDYYLGTTDVDFLTPSLRGLPYEELEGLLDGIPARKRLLLIDACNSGEVDKEGAVLVAAAPTSEKGVKSRGFKTVKASKVSLQGSFELVQELFADLRRTSGAAVISSASGKEFAFESARWNNGVFTFSLLDGLKSGGADADKDGAVKVSELRDFVIERVQKLTEGQQTPTSRRENLELDFPVYFTVPAGDGASLQNGKVP